MESKLTDAGKQVVSVCRTGKHDLIEIYSDGTDMEARVIRWCQICGAVVIDVDCDTRVHAGNFMKMKFPEIVK